MISEHLSESQLQQYVLDEAGCNAAVLQHVALCKRCKKEVMDFRLMLAEIKKLPKPISDYDLPALVLERLPDSTVKSRKDAWVYILVFVALVLLVLPVYLFWDHFAKIAIGVLPLAIWVTAAISISIIIAGGIGQYRNYKRKIATIRSCAGLI
jgi:anti-sigma factor RsiW